MPKEPMTSKERWLAVLTRQTPDRVPMDYWATPEITAKLMQYFNANEYYDMLDHLNVDYLAHAGPRYVGPTPPAGTDIFGIRYADVNYGTGIYGETISHPLAKYKTVEEIVENYTWPDPDWWDYSLIPSQIAVRQDHAVRGGGSEPFLKYKDLRGDVQAMMDLVENPEIVEYCLGKLFDLAYTDTLRIYEAVPGKVNVTYIAEDMGGQNDLMMSPRHIRRFLLPGMKRMIDLAHSGGAFAFHHNDGNCSRILPDMIALGIDVLNPIQWRAAGMEREMLKEKYGQQLIFHGAVDNQYTLPFGSVEEVRQEVRDNLRILGAGGGYIIAPCHNLQPITPLENILAMYDEGFHAGAG